MKTWTKAACLTLCAGLLVSGVATGLRGDPNDDLKRAQQAAQKQLEEAKKKMPQPPAAPGGAGEDPMMAMMMELSKPVAEHDIIKNFAGTWNADMKMWMDPSAKEPTESKGTMKGTLLHGGRFLFGEFSGSFNNMPFTGTMMWGYNRNDKRYESTWCDAWGTGLMFSTGQPSNDGKTVESTGSFRMPGPDGKMMEITQREKTTMVNKDKYTLEMWHSTKDQGETKVMEITYTRAGDAAKPGAHPAAPAVPTVPGITMPPASK